MNLCWTGVNRFDQNSETGGSGISCKLGRCDSTPSSLCSLVMVLWGFWLWLTAWAGAERWMNCEWVSYPLGGKYFEGEIWEQLVPEKQEGRCFPGGAVWIPVLIRQKWGWSSILHSLACRTARVVRSTQSNPLLPAPLLLSSNLFVKSSFSKTFFSLC